MGNPDFETLRHSALGMLADGNSIESVAHVLGVPVDVVLGWRAHPDVATPASALADTAPPAVPTPAPARDARARVRFNDELVYVSSIAFRAVGLVCGIVLAVVGIGVATLILRGPSHDMGDIAVALTILIVAGLAARMMLGWARRILVLGTDNVIVPTLLGQTAMAYSDVAGYALEPHVLRLDAQSSYKGRLLTIRSRRPGAEPVSVFLFDDYPVDHGIFERLDEVTRANFGAPALPPLIGATPRGSSARGGSSLAIFAVIALLGGVQLWPLFRDGLHTLSHRTPPLAALRHVAGSVTAASVCWTRSKSNGGEQVMTVVIAQPSGHEDVMVPCVIDQDELIRHGPRRLAVDLDPDARPVAQVYQVSLDGRVVLAYELVRARERRIEPVIGLVGVVLPLGGVGLVSYGLIQMWRRSRRQAVNV
jgi:hypothetical protein